MKTGKTLTQLAQELERINETKKDLIVPVSKMSMTNEAKIEIATVGEIPLNNWSHGQLASYTDIPKAYYDRIKQENASLLAQNVNHSLSLRQDDKRLIRTLDGNVRALLSNRYRMLDSYDLAETVLPIMLNNNMAVKSAEITERNTYIRAVMPKLEGEVTKGDVVQYGLQISSSDVGAGSLRVEPLIYRLVCTNGLITSQALRKYHIGKVAGEFNDIQEILSDRAKELSDAAFWQSVYDIVLNSINPKIFEAEIEKLRDAASQKITNYNLEQVIDVTCKTVGYTATKETKNKLLAQLANGNEGAGLTKWGLSNSFTALASHDESFGFDDSVELERIGGKIITLSNTDWQKIAA
jgi:hypothetical protein